MATTSHGWLRELLYDTHRGAVIAICLLRSAIFGVQENINANIGAKVSSLPGPSLLGAALQMGDSHMAYTLQPGSSDSFSNSLAMLKDLAHGRVGKSSKLSALSPKEQSPAFIQLPEAPLHRPRTAVRPAANHAKLQPPQALTSFSLLSSATQLGSSHCDHEVATSKGQAAIRQRLHQQALAAGSQGFSSAPAVSLQLPASPVRSLSRTRPDSMPRETNTDGVGSFAAEFLSNTVLSDKLPQLDSNHRTQCGLDAPHQVAQKPPQATRPTYAAAGGSSRRAQSHPQTADRAVTAAPAADDSLQFPLRHSDFSRCKASVEVFGT